MPNYYIETKPEGKDTKGRLMMFIRDQSDGHNEQTVPA